MLRAWLALTFCTLNTIPVNDAEGVAQKISAINEFKTYKIVIPKVRYGKQQLFSTSIDQSEHVRKITVEFSAFGDEIILKLQLNGYLFSGNYTETTSHHNYSSIHRSSSKPASDNCYYIGYIAGHETRSTAAVSTCTGLRGFFMTEVEGFHIESIDRSLDGRHYIFRDSDYIGTNFTCGTDASYSKTSSAPKLKRSLRRPHDAPAKPILRWPYDANEKTMLVELYIANDFSQFLSLQRDTSEVIRRTKDIVNIVSSLYRPLNIYVALVGVEVWVDGDRIEIVDNADKTMNNFLEYRRNYICPKYRNDNAQLITGRTLGDGVVGKAPIMTICTWQYSGGVNLFLYLINCEENKVLVQDHSTLVGPVATTVAHEMGHNFGLTHDTDDCGCPDDRCIMASSSGGMKNPTKWSDCSKQQFADSFHQGMDYCLHNLPEHIYDGPVCGNGFTEPGEQCDCGLPQDCSSSCCNATTCKLQPNASCAMGECCDQATCQLKPSATSCRSVLGDCDLGEYCDGLSEFCPFDAYRPDGTVCYTGSVSSYCYQGKCNSHDEQCKLLWGHSGEASHQQCYKNFNVLGTVNGHCGFSWVDNKSFKKCDSSDVMCGMLHCNHRNEKLMFWKEALAYNLPEAWVLANGTRQECKGVILDVGLDMIDPGMVPDGAKCGNGKMCIGQHCIDITSLGLKSCPDCHSHGVCNNLQQCHCDPGYAPPNCDEPGGGGSEHSGPMTVPHHNIGLAIGMCFLSFILLVLIGLLVVCAYRHNEKLKQFWRERDKYKSVHVDVHRHDVERPPLPPPPAGRSPVKLTNGSVPDQCVIYRPNNRASAAHDRPRSVAAPRGTNSDAVPLSGSNNVNVKRTTSVRGAPISSPHLQSSTNHAAMLSSKNARPYANTEIQLMPTRTAPPPPPGVAAVEPFNRNTKPTNEHPLRKAPSRPPLPATSVIRKELDHDDDSPMRSPSGPPPAPPDSRHRFYSPPVALQRNVSDIHANGQRTVTLSTSPHRPGMANSSRLPASGVKKQDTPNGQTSESGVHGSAATSGVNSSNFDRRQVSQVKPTVEKHLRPRVYRTGVNESQC